jgi:hypothetical protein
MKKKEKIAVVKRLLAMDENPAVLIYAIDEVLGADAMVYSFTAHTEALKLIKKATKHVNRTSD